MKTERNLNVKGYISPEWYRLKRLSSLFRIFFSYTDFTVTQYCYFLSNYSILNFLLQCSSIPLISISICCSSAKSCPALLDPMDCSTPGFSILHYLPEFAQTHVHWVDDAIQPSHLLSPSSPDALNLSQHQDFFQTIGSSHQVAKVLELQLQHQSFQWIFRVDFLYDWWVWSPCSPRDSKESSPAPQYKSIHSSVLSLFYDPTLTSVHDYWQSHSFDYTDLCG